MDDYSFKTMKSDAHDASPKGVVAPDVDVYDDVTVKNGGYLKSELKAGDKLVNGRYEILSELGRGGMGIVYRCFDSVAGIEVALKALPPELSHNQDEMDEVRDNFQLVSRLVHQNIAVSKNIEKDNQTGDTYIIMELVSGENLRQWMKRMRREEGGVSLDAVLPILRQIATALDYAHGMKIMHRDIKPANIMLTSNGQVKVMDFGLVLN